jgi:adenylate cyclase
MSRRPKTLGSWLTIIIFGAVAGLVFNWFTRGGDRLLVGVIYGIAICVCTIGFERGLIFSRLRRRLQQLPSLLFILATEILLIICAAIGCLIAGTLVWSLDLVEGTTWEVAVTMPINVLIYTLLVVALFVFVTRMRDLLGADTFRNLLLGRYHRPAQEERVFLFVDISGSTAYAEAHGDLRAQEYLGAVFATIAEPIRRHRGAIADYIGDLAIITWPLQRGISNATCVECLIDINRELAKDPTGWQQRFGVVPQVRAALHGGSVVTAEIGVDRHKIAYFGDVMNTTARLEALSRILKEQVLISGDLLSRLPALPEMVRARALGEHALRGRDQVMAIAALDIALLPSVASAA